MAVSAARFPVEEATIAMLHAAYVSGRPTAVSVCQAHLDRIATYDRTGPALGAIIVNNPDALADAAALDAAVEATGKLIGPLHGIPVLVKDNYDVAGLQTTGGSAALPGRPRQRGGRPPACRKRGEPSSSADRNEVVHADALHDEKLARAIRLPVHIMRGLRWHRAALTRQKTIDVTWRPCLDHHRPLKTNEAVADLSVVMPWHALAGGKGQHLHAQIGTLGDQLTVGDRIITAVAGLHRSVLLNDRQRRRFRKLRRDLGALLVVLATRLPLERTAYGCGFGAKEKSRERRTSMGVFLSSGFLVCCRFLVWRCVQVRLACSAGDSPAGVKVRAP